MSRHAEITIAWADRTLEDGGYTFRLPIGQIRKLEEKLDRGPAEIFDRLRDRKYRVDDITETIRLALQAGGSVVSAAGVPDDARINQLIRDYVAERPLMVGVVLAARILHAALAGPEDDEIPKPPAGRETTSHPSRAESTGSLRSTDGALSSDTPPPRSIN